MATRDPLLDAADIAALLGIRRGTVHTYRYRGVMPAPDRTIGRSPAWYLSTVRRWDSSRRKLDANRHENRED